MEKVFSFFTENVRFSFLVTLLMVFFGISGLTLIKREYRPPVDFARATIVTIYPGSSPEEVEEKITTKIEDQIRGIDGIRSIVSLSQPGRSTISIRVDLDNVDVQFVMDEIQRAVQRVRDFPRDILDNPTFSQLNAKEIPILELALIGDNKNRQRDSLAENLRDHLEDDPGVSSVSLSGYREREFQILLDPMAMDRYHVGITEVVDAVRARTQNIPAGFIRVPGDQKLVRVTGQVKTAEETEDIVIRSNFSGQKIKVSDVAKVRDGMQDASIHVRVNGRPATLLTITKRANADTIKASERLMARIDKYKDKLPAGYEIIKYNDEATRIEKRLDIVTSNAFVGMALVLVILLMFLPGILGLMSSLSLPLALAGTVGVMVLWGININTVTMLAMIIAIGMLVDNSVVISENYARLRMEGLNPNKAAIQAAYQFWLPLTATVMTTVVAFLPMLVTKGIMGQFIKWIPIMVSIALSLSLFEAFFLLPARLKFTMSETDVEIRKEKNENKKGHWFDKVKFFFERFMLGALNRRYIVLCAVTLLIFGSMFIAVVFNKFELFPREVTEYYSVKYEAPIATTLDDMDKYSGDLSEKIMDTLGRDVVRYVIAQSGMTREGNQRKNADNVGLITIAIPFDVAKDTDTAEMLTKLRTIDKGSLVKLNFEGQAGGPPVGSALEVTFRSRNYTELRNIVDEFKSEVAKIKGVEDLQDDEVAGGPEFKIIPDYQAISRLNLTTEQIGTALRTALQGAIVSELSLGGEEFDMRIRYSDKYRETMDSLRRTKIWERTGKLIPLMSVVKVSDQMGPTVRKHDDFKRAISVISDIDRKVIDSLTLNKKAEEIFDSMAAKYPSVTASFGGEEESRKESTTSLKNAMIIAVFGIFAILVFLFSSFSKAFLVLSSIPLGLVGVGTSFFLHNKPLSFFAMIGVVGLAGVVVNAAIVLVSYIEDLSRNRGQLSFYQILAKASSDRLRAVVATSLTTLGGLFPTAYGIGGYDPVLVPMTLALAWGLVSGTILTLIWVPCGFAITEDIKLRLGLKTFSSPPIQGIHQPKESSYEVQNQTLDL